MSGIELRDCQIEAVNKMKNGCILCGGVGSGKSRTALAYYYIQMGGKLGTPNYVPMDDLKIKDLYIITTAKKRDDAEWDGEMVPFLLTDDKTISPYSNKVVVDSWNNVTKYKDVTGAFFIFDEDRVTGKGAWVKAFLKIARSNDWIILSATPGDKYEDYIPVFIANGFFKNRTEFINRHVIYKRNLTFPVIDRYLDTRRLDRLIKSILVDIELERDTVKHHVDTWCDYDKEQYKFVMKERWNPYENQPIKNASEFCYTLRRIVNTDQSREVAVLELFEDHPKAIIFYNLDCELEILRQLCENNGITYAEWNGHKHQGIPDCDSWMYFVQYNSGSEGWNSITTDTIIFWSQNYSYKTMVQAAGRIDRINTPYKNLYYFHLKSHSGIDLAIARALKNKKKFNESRFAGG